jgi:long-chain acyl-CoA synthetase
MVYGDKKKYLTALITLNAEALADWAKQHGQSGDYKTLTQNDAVRKDIQSWVDKLNAGLASYESIKTFTILDHDFEQDSGELTPTLKVKRKFCNEKYRDVLEGMYRQ